MRESFRWEIPINDEQGFDFGSGLRAGMRESLVIYAPADPAPLGVASGEQVSKAELLGRRVVPRLARWHRGRGL